MGKSTYKQSLFALALAVALSTVGSVTPALARGGTAVGVSMGSTDKLSNFGLAYNGVLPKGQVALVSAPDGSAQSMAFKLDSINVPDGTVLPVRVIMGRKTLLNFSYYSTYGVTYTEADGTVTVNHNSVSLALDTSNGDVVPDFVSPSVGTTDIRVLSPDGTTEILSGITGHFSP